MFIIQALIGMGIWLGFVILVVTLAYRWNRNALIWGMYAVTFWPLALIHLLIVGAAEGLTSHLDIYRSTLVATMICGTLGAMSPASASPDCNEQILQEAVDQANSDLGKPSVMLAVGKARKDWTDDKDFDDENSMKYLAAMANSIDVEQLLKAGVIDQACDQYIRSRQLFELLRDAE